MISTDDRAILDGIQASTLSVLKGVFGNHSKSLVILDFPRHKNAGDALIWSGEREYMRRLGIKRVYTADIGRFNIRELRRHLPEAVVAFHGGGNLGDIWEEYQPFREHVIGQLKGHKVIILPQTLMFTSRERAASANRIFADHGDVTILLRDSVSMQRAESDFPDVKVVYCPDMAFGNSPLRRESRPDHDFVFLSRQDREKQSMDDLLLPSTFGPVDWESGMNFQDNLKWYTLKFPGIVYRRIPPFARRPLESVVHKVNDHMSETNLTSAVRILSRGRVVISDRLHAHIFAILLGSQHVVMDNNYGKISSIFSEYSGAFSTAHLAGDPREAESIARELLTKSR